MIDRMWRDIDSFYVKFHFPRTVMPTPLGALGASGFERLRHLREEIDELEAAIAAGDVAAQTDALVDLVYVALGTAWVAGLPWASAWDAVHAANMRKVSGTGPKRVAKPAGWTDPIDEIRATIARIRVAA